MPTKQETFDTVVNHLRKQGHQSRIYGVGCAYRGESGDMCAAGCLIPDDRYDSKFERCAVVGSIGRFDDDAVKDLHNLIVELGHDPRLVRELQTAHDFGVSHWEKRFARIAEEFNLDYEPPEPVTA